MHFSLPARVSLPAFFRKGQHASSASSKDAAVVTAYLSKYLHEPKKVITKILRSNRAFLNEVNRFRNCQQSDRNLEAHRSSFDFPQQQQFESLSQEHPGSRVLVSYHFGDFIYGCSLLATRENQHRQQYFLTQLQSTAAFTSNMQRSFGRDEVSRRIQLTTDSIDLIQLASALRRGNTSILTFADLPTGFGERVQVSFLGRDAWFPKGPAMLALAGKAALLPVINLKEKGRNQILLYPQIETALREGESLIEAAHRITQELVTILEAVICQHPWQWRYLAALPTYFNEAPLRLDGELSKHAPNKQIPKEASYDNGCHRIPYQSPEPKLGQTVLSPVTG